MGDPFPFLTFPFPFRFLAEATVVVPIATVDVQLILIGSQGWYTNPLTGQFEQTEIGQLAQPGPADDRRPHECNDRHAHPESVQARRVAEHER